VRRIVAARLGVRVLMVTTFDLGAGTAMIEPR
jgi:hypothetical protein